MLEAAEAMREDRGFQFVIAGEGPSKGELTERYGHLPNVRFLPLQPEERLGEFLNLADCHVLPQSAEVSELVLPSKLGGMLASGKRLLVTAEPDTEIARFLGPAAKVVPPGDPMAIVGGLKAMREEQDVTAGERLALARSIDIASSLDLFERVLFDRNMEQAGALSGAVTPAVPPRPSRSG